MGQYLKSAREKKYYDVFSSMFNDLLYKTTVKASNFFTMEQVHHELQKLSSREEGCYDFMMRRKHVSSSVAYVALPEDSSREMCSIFDEDTVVSTARSAADRLAEESMVVGMVAYYDCPPKGDLVQRRSPAASKPMREGNAKEVHQPQNDQTGHAAGQCLDRSAGRLKDAAKDHQRGGGKDHHLKDQPVLQVDHRDQQEQPADEQARDQDQRIRPSSEEPDRQGQPCQLDHPCPGSPSGAAVGATTAAKDDIGQGDPGTSRAGCTAVEATPVRRTALVGQRVGQPVHGGSAKQADRSKDDDHRAWIIRI